MTLDSRAMNRLMVVAWVAGVGCSGASSSSRPAEPRAPLDPVARTLADAFARKDVVAIRSALRPPLRYSGLVFTDAECTRQFSAPAELGAEQLDAFAHCLVSLPFRVSTRDYAINQTAMLEYEPGFEVQIRYKTNGNVAWLEAIGFTSHLGSTNTLPTITPQALEAARLPGPTVALTTAERAALDASLRTGELGYESVWIELCTDDTGAVTTTHAVATTSLTARDVFKAQAARWRFRPLMIGGRATAVCAMTHFAYPDAARTEPVPFIGDLPADAAVASVRPTALHRVHGDPLITPEDKHRFGGGRVVGSFKVCIDETGKVDSVKLLDSTSIPDYDEKIMRRVRGWRYRPFMAGGRTMRACTALTFIYTQR